MTTYYELIQEKRLLEMWWIQTNDRLPENYNLIQEQAIIIEKNELYNKLVDINKELHWLYIHRNDVVNKSEPCNPCKPKIMRTFVGRYYGSGSIYNNFAEL